MWKNFWKIFLWKCSNGTLELTFVTKIRVKLLEYWTKSSKTFFLSVLSFFKDLKKKWKNIFFFENFHLKIFSNYTFSIGFLNSHMLEDLLVFNLAKKNLKKNTILTGRFAKNRFLAVKAMKKKIFFRYWKSLSKADILGEKFFQKSKPKSMTIFLYPHPNNIWCTF